jgi:hypothetical protein
LPYVVSGLVTLAFGGCRGETQVINAADTAVGGEEGDGVGPSAGTSGAGKGGGANQAGKGGGASTGGAGNAPGVGGSTAGGGSVGGTAGLPGGGSGVGGTTGGAGFGATSGAPSGGFGGTHGNVAGGAGSAGSPNGGVGNTGNVGGRGSAGLAGSAGGPVAPYCNSSSGEGCLPNAFCVDLATEPCNPDASSSCTGACAQPLAAANCAAEDSCPSGMRCLPNPEDPAASYCVGLDAKTCFADDDCAPGFTCVDGVCAPIAVSCPPISACDAAVCAPGYAGGLPGSCPLTCVPIPNCACHYDDECPYPSSCDRIHGRCAIAAQAPGCSMPYDPGPCDGNYSVYAYVNGSCSAVHYGGCEGNDNRFATLEECLLRCESTPTTEPCPGPRIAANICVSCAANGSCQAFGAFCAETCSGDGDCTTLGQSCVQGVCQAVCNPIPQQ